MEEERFPSSRDNPRVAADRPPRPAAAAPSIMVRFHAMLREREEELKEATGEDPPPPLTADDVVRCYEDVLAELTFNSKPIISELTMIAGHQVRYAKEIADAICARVLEVPVDQKLPSLYLIDSIVKNIGHEYVKILATRLPKVFCEAYNQVHPSQYSPMRHLFKTWSQVFPLSVLRKIEDELQFSPSENERPSGIASTRPSKSTSPCPSHGIHVNPKYLEARRQFEQSSVIHAVDTHKNAQESDYDLERLEGLSSENPEGWSGATRKLHSMPHARVSSGGLQAYGQKPSAQYSEYDLDQPELLPQRLSVAREGSPQTAMLRPSSMIDARGSVPYLKNKISVPLSPRRIGLKRPVSPPIVRSHNGTSPRKIGGRASTSHFGSGYEPGRLSDPNGWLGRSWPSNEDPQHVEASTLYKLNNGSGKQHPRDLIDAYGNPRGRVSSYEKFSKVQRLDVNGIASEAAARKWKNSDEEEYDWEDMSPTLSDRSRRNSLPRVGPSAGSLGIRTGFSRPDPAVLESDFGRRSWPGQAQLHAADNPSFMVEDRIAARGSRSASMMKYLDGTTSQSDIGKLSYLFPQPTHKSLSPRSRSRVTQMPVAAKEMTSAAVQRLPIPHDYSPDIDLPHHRLSNAHADPLKMDMSTQRPHSSAPVILPSIHKSQPQPLLPIPQTQKPISSSPDVSLATKSIAIQGSHPTRFVPEQQYDIADRKNKDSVKLLHLPYKPSGLPHLNQQTQKQGISEPIPSQGSYGSILPPAEVMVPSYSVGQPLNFPPTLLHGATASALQSSSFVTPSIAVQNTTDALLHAPAGLLPPLPPGPPPSLSQIGLTSQSMSSAVSGSSTSAFSGLISSLMAQGLISLKSPPQPQDSLGVEFNLELLKVRHESAINSLYADLPRQCTTCGLRFKCQEEHSSHMDWHVTKNRISRNRKQKPSRKWFVSAKEWLSGAEILGNDVVPGFLPTESVAEKKEDKEVAVPADENQNVCALCGEPFEDFYSDETEEWMYRGAVYLNAPDGNLEGLDRSQLGPIVHSKCRSETNECSAPT
ncbi:polyadenylation and cleavage factor homolog 4-like isoform X1 [Musa acuminata AAA Group]|uniref:polyadenylation and cleavage factor homolog 4-like isoform X1 n=1 Tax=Musa acuminata AAA Group TaxID=214697 RepID=UPI0031E1BA58